MSISEQKFVKWAGKRKYRKILNAFCNTIWDKKPELWNTYLRLLERNGISIQEVLSTMIRDKKWYIRARAALVLKRIEAPWATAHAYRIEKVDLRDR